MAIAAGALAYLAVAYVLLPLGWSRYETRHPWLDEVAGITLTKDGIPGDPLNVALVGTETEVQGILAKAAWDPADALGLRSDMRIAADTVLRRSYEDAPVSSLYLFGRKEDLAYEQPVGDDLGSARQPTTSVLGSATRLARSRITSRPTWTRSVTISSVRLSPQAGSLSSITLTVFTRFVRGATAEVIPGIPTADSRSASFKTTGKVP
jgi:hypothetical protein